jgi:hypothetical protein
MDSDARWLIVALRVDVVAPISPFNDNAIQVVDDFGGSLRLSERLLLRKTK